VWDERPIHVDDAECSSDEKPEMVKQCEDGEGARDMRDAKCLNTLKFERPDASAAAAASVGNIESEDAEIENTAGSDEKLPLVGDPSHSTHRHRQEFFIMHRFHPLVNHRAMPMERELIEEIPISGHRCDNDDDEVSIAVVSSLWAQKFNVE
jgi:hypothetical protein